jgi:hypothetical protein
MLGIAIYVLLSVDGMTMTSGQGFTKIAARQEAARVYLNQIGHIMGPSLT